MRILIITELFPDSEVPEVTGGVENRVYYVVRRLRTRHDVTVLAGETQGGSQWRPASVRSIPMRLRRMAKILWRGLRAEFDVVESSILVVHPIAFLLGRLKRKPVVFWYPDVLIGQWRTDAFSPLAGRIGELYERLVLKLPIDRYIAISDSTRDKLIAAGIKPERIDVVHCGFDPAVATAARDERRDQAKGELSIITASRLVPYKRVDLVIRALALLAGSLPDLRLRIVGQGPDRPRLEELAATLGVTDRVDFLGFLPVHDDVLRAIAGSSVFVSASEIEGFGISVVEAAAVGVPFVITDMPVFREVTREGAGGLLFRLGDANDLAAKLEQLLTDDALRDACTTAGGTLVESYTWDALADETGAVFESVVAARRH